MSDQLRVNSGGKKKSKMKTDRLCDHRIIKTPHIFLLFTDCKKWLRHEGEEKCFGGERKDGMVSLIYFTAR